MLFMGQGSKFGGGSGLNTRGGKTLLKKQDDKIINKDPILKKIVDSGAKINIKDVVFTAKDKSGQLVWLEKGNKTSGLEHIKIKHQSDFVSKHNIKASSLPAHLKRVVTKGTIVNSRAVNLPNGRVGYEKVYVYKGKYYTLGAIGTNGYIVSMYPINGGK
jgi:hypothetical protein